MNLEAHDLRRIYGHVLAVDGVSLSAGPGEVLGLLGPNGAGKTTAIRMLTTILKPTSGTFSIAGIPHTRPSEIRARIGVLPESAGYPEQQTGTEFLTYCGQLFGQTRADARGRTSYLLDQVGLGDRGPTSIAGYSRGMRQRLGIARALINDPSVVFFDEPTLGLDPAGQRDVLRMVAGVATERGATVILSTHFLDEVEKTCSRVLILNRGQLVAEGTVAEVAHHAAAPRRARFRVPAEYRDRALTVLRELESISEAEPAEAGPESLTTTFAESAEPADRAQAHLRESVNALADAGIPVLAFELEGARLSDAFMAVTGG